MVVLLPVGLMLLRTVVETLVPEDSDNPAVHAALFVGKPIVALLITVLASMYLFGTRLGLSADNVSGRVGARSDPSPGSCSSSGQGEVSSRPLSTQGSPASSPRGSSRRPCPLSWPGGSSPSLCAWPPDLRP